MTRGNGYYGAMEISNQMQNLEFMGNLMSTFGGSEIVSRKSTYVQAQNQQVINSATGGQNQRTTFQLPRSGYIDMQTLAIYGTLNITADTNATYTTVQYGVSDLIDRMRLYIQGNTEIEDVRFYNHVRANTIIHNNTVQWFETSASVLELWGLYTSDNFSVGVSPSGVPFYHSPMLGFLGSKNFFPAFVVGPLQLDIYWAAVPDALISVQSAGFVPNTANYLIQNLRLYYDVCTLKAGLNDRVVEQVKSPLGWQVHYNSFETYDAPGLGQGSALFEQAFSVRLGSIKSVFAMFSPSGARSTGYDYLMSQLPGHTQSQWRVNNVNFPEDPMTDDATVYREFCKAIGVLNTLYRGGVVRNIRHIQQMLTAVAGGSTLATGTGHHNMAVFNNGIAAGAGIVDVNNWTWSSIAGGISGVGTTGRNFIIAYEFEVENDDEKISGLTTSSSSADILIRVVRTGVTTGMDTFLAVLCDKIFTIQGAGDGAVTRVDK